MDESNTAEQENIIVQEDEMQVSEGELNAVFDLIKTRKKIAEFGIEINLDGIKRGRPSVMTKDVIVALSQAWLFGCNDEEACTYAGIHPASLYEFQKDKPDFLEYKEHLKRNPVIKARATLYRALDDPQIAWKYLQRKTTDLAENDKPNVQLNVQLNQLVEQDRKRIES